MLGSHGYSGETPIGTGRGQSYQPVIAATIVGPILQYAHSLWDKAIDHMWHFLLSVLKAGPIPQHVAFIMDGNRRYARAKEVKVKQGHVEGYIALRRVCLTSPFIINTKLCWTRFCHLQPTGVGNILNPRRQGHLYIRLCHWQLQPRQWGGRWCYERSWKRNLGTLQAWVRSYSSFSNAAFRTLYW